MDKRLAKRHAREVARKREKIKISEPDVRTPEQIEADREASGALNSRGVSEGPAMKGSSRSLSNSTSAPQKTGGA